jgi:hypothetical protein
MAVPDEIPHGSKEFITVVLDSPDDLTTSTVDIGLSTDETDQPSSWLAATWPDTGVNVARTSQVWDTTSVTPGFYAVWARVNDSPEILPRRYGVVRVV